MSYFDDPKEMLAEAETLIRESRDESVDEAILRGFYNGQTLDEKDAGSIGSLKNHLMGYDSMNDAKLALERIYTGQKLMFRVKLPHTKVQDKQKWEIIIENEFNKIIRKSGRFKPEWKGLCGTITLMGRGCLMFTDKYDWCPRLMAPMVPRRTGTRPDDVPYTVIPGDLKLKELKQKLQAAKANPDSGWKTANVMAAVNALTKNIGTSMSRGSISTATNVTPLEEDEAAYDGWGSNLRQTILVFHVFENCMEESGATVVRHSIIARHDADLQKEYTKETGDILPILFYQDNYFADTPRQYLNPFFIDCQIGRTTTWHNTMGLGRLNYDTDVEAEAMLNEALAGSMENMRRLYSVAEGGDIETYQQFLSGKDAGNIIPAGLVAQEVTKNPNFPVALQMLDVLKRQSAAHARSAIPNTADGTAKELEVQAIERQGRNALALAARMDDFYDDTTKLGEEMLRRFIMTDPLPQDKAYHEISRFQKALKDKGIPLSRLREKDRDGNLKHIEVEANRSVGQGDRVAEVMINRMLMSNIHMFSPQAQEMIKRRIVSSETGDTDFAEELVPDRPKVDPRQIERANTENQICINRGITGFVPQLNDDDMPQYHIQEHLGGLEALLAKGAAQGWDQMDIGAFKAMGSHTYLHVQQMEADPNQKNTARQLTGRLQEIAGRAGEFVKAAQEKQQQDEISAGERIRLQQKDKQIELAQIKEHNNIKFKQDNLDLKRAELASDDVKAGTAAELKRRQLANAEYAAEAKSAIDMFAINSRPEPQPTTN